MTVQAITDNARSPITTLMPYQQQGVFPASQADSLLVDMTLYARTGLRGGSAAETLEKAGLSLPKASNQATENDKATVLRLSAKEYWLLANENNDPLPELAMGKECYSLFCQDSHAWMALKSPFKAEVMAKLCGVDLREAAFASGMIAQTVVAGANAIVVHHQLGAEKVFSILCDRSVGHYMWEVMLDALQEFNGKAAMIDQL